MHCTHMPRWWGRNSLVRSFFSNLGIRTSDFGIWDATTLVGLQNLKEYFCRFGRDDFVDLFRVMSLRDQKHAKFYLDFLRLRPPDLGPFGLTQNLKAFPSVRTRRLCAGLLLMDDQSVYFDFCFSRARHFGETGFLGIVL
ncbi:unnamed protein product [Microthlaspi erraticum]|uniref:Uncharacterized protein n=1 Tax=Microthlaspi erraticum TaxID=1685480 RepID=A0A6D2KVY9_9BRAS|nr:unnamed protein product [Microthlaspi erraticum]